MTTIVNHTVHDNSRSCPKMTSGTFDMRWQLQLNKHGRGSGPWQLPDAR